MKINMGRFTANSLNPVIGLANSGTVLYSNIAGEPLLHKWNVRVGEKVPSYIEYFVQNAISQKSPTKMEVEVENKVYLVTFHPTPEEKEVSLYGFDITDQKKLEKKLQESENKYRDIIETAKEVDVKLGAIFDHIVETANEVNAKLKETLNHLEELVRKRTLELEIAYTSLKENEIRLAEAQMIAHVGNWDWNLVTDELYWSDEMYRIFGVDSQKFSTNYSNFLICVSPDDRDYVDNATKEALKGKTYAPDYKIVSANGKERIIHSKGEVIFEREGTPIRMKATVQDITERKKAEEKIRTLANIVESSGDAILTLSHDGIIITWNKGAERIYAYSSEEVLGKSVSVLAPDNLKGETERLIEKVKQGNRTQHYVTSRLKKGGKLIDVSITLSPVFDEFKKFVAISAVTLDITSKIDAEKSLLKAEITRKQELHHRIKNNLQVISSLLDLQADKFKNREFIKNSEFLEAFRESRDRVISMALIHEELYKRKQFETLDLSAYIRKLVEKLFQTYRLDDKNIHMYMDLEENVFLNMDNAVPLGIIVTELVSNSLKHAFSGRDEGRIDINLRREKNGGLINNREDGKYEGCKSTGFVLKVADDGVGISESIDLENSKSLGIQLVTTLVDQLNGKLELKRNSGSEFTINFTLGKIKKHQRI
jgi:PAS domain S-box-containing protein